MAEQLGPAARDLRQVDKKPGLTATRVLGIRAEAIPTEDEAEDVYRSETQKSYRPHKIEAPEAEPGLGLAVRKSRITQQRLLQQAAERLEEEKRQREEEARRQEVHDRFGHRAGISHRKLAESAPPVPNPVAALSAPPITVYTEARTLRRDGRVAITEGFTSAPPPHAPDTATATAALGATRAFSKPLEERHD